MSRAKKRTKSGQRRRRPSEHEQRAKREREVADKIGNLSCGYSAADELAAMCSLHAEKAACDLDLVTAAEQLWRRAAHEAHSLTRALADLQAELQRHCNTMTELEDRFDALMDAAPHDHIKPDADDANRIRAALFGPANASLPRAQPSPAT